MASGSQRLCCFAFLAFVCLYSDSALSAAYQYGSDAVKPFFEYHCMLKLPNKETWQWQPHDGRQYVIAAAKSQEGMELSFLIHPDAVRGQLNDDFIRGFENSFFKHEALRKVSGRKLDFQGVPAYELNAVNTQTKAKLNNLVFINHQNIYSLQFVFPQTAPVNKAFVEKLHTIFSWTGTAEKSSPPQPIQYEEDTAPDDTVYQAIDPNLFELKLDGTSFKMLVSNHQFVKHRSGPKAIWLTVLIDETVYSAISEGYKTNVIGDLIVQIEKDPFDKVLAGFKEKYLSQDDMLVKESADQNLADGGGRSVAMLFVTSAGQGRVADHRAVQVIQMGDSVVSVVAICAQGMNLPPDFKNLLNNVLQSSLKSLHVNEKPIDTSMLARHVKKK